MHLIEINIHKIIELCKKFHVRKTVGFRFNSH